MSPKILLSFLSVLAFYLVSPTSARATTSYKVGLSNVDLTPSVRKQLMGYPSNERFAQDHVYTDGLGLSIRAVFISQNNGTEPIALVSADLVNICPSDSDYARDPGNYSVSIPNLTRERVMINITHTHNTPSNCDSSVRVMHDRLQADATPGSAWRLNLRAKLIEAIEEAYEASQSEDGPANLKFYRNKLNIAVNSRTGVGVDMTDASGKVINSETGYDQTLDVVEVVRDDGSRKGVLFFYGAHPALLGPSAFPDGNHYNHPDHPGFARKKIEDATTGADIAIYFQGAAGDVIAVSSLNSTPYAKSQQQGEAMGQRVLDIMAGTAPQSNHINGQLIQPSDGGNTAFSRVWAAPFQNAAGNDRLGGTPGEPRGLRCPASGPGNEATEDWLKWAERYCDGTTGHGGGNARCSLKPGVTPDTSWDIEMQTISIGKWRVAGFSHEAVTRHGVSLRQRWPDDWVSVVSYINRTQNYLPTSAQINQDNNSCWPTQSQTTCNSNSTCSNPYQGFVAQLWNGHPSTWATFATTGGLYDIDAELAEIIKAETPQRVNYALPMHGATASASSQLDSNRPASAVINGDRRGLHWGSDPATGSGWHDATQNAFPDSLEINLGAVRTIDEINVFTLQDSYTSPSEPTETMTFTLYGLTEFEVQYWNGEAWATVEDGDVSANNKVWRKFTFAPISTTKLKVVVSDAEADYSRITEVEAWGAATTRKNVALATEGATATASSTADSGRAASAVINGDRRGLHWGSDPSTGSGWHDATHNAFPDSVEVSFAGPREINQVNVFGVQDSYASPSEPTDSMTFSLYGLTAFDIEYWNGTQWALVPGGAVTGNNKVWRTVTFPPLTTTKIRVVVNQGVGGHSRVVEVEALTTYGFLSHDPGRKNVASALNGATVTASSTADSGRAAQAAINGDRRGLHWGSDPFTGSGWHDATHNAYPDTLEVTFFKPREINQVNVFGVQDSYTSPSEPTDSMTFSLYGLQAFDIEYWDSATSQWTLVPGGAVTGNNKVWRSVTFTPLTTSKIRVVVSQGVGGHSRVVEVEALTP
jgi:F5/8 type C domain